MYSSPLGLPLSFDYDTCYRAAQVALSELDSAWACDELIRGEGGMLAV